MVSFLGLGSLPSSRKSLPSWPTILLEPWEPKIESLPEPPTRLSSPLPVESLYPPHNLSFPVPPSRLSVPRNPMSVSLPPLPRRLSSPLVPLRVSGPSVPILVTASATPLATKRVRDMVANNSMVRLIRRAAFLQGGGVSSVVRLDSRRPFISNTRSIRPYRELYDGLCHPA